MMIRLPALGLVWKQLAVLAPHLWEPRTALPSQNPQNSLLFLRFCSIRPARSSSNLSAISGNLFPDKPLGSNHAAGWFFPRAASGFLIALCCAWTLFQTPESRAATSAFPVFHQSDGETTGSFSLWAPWPFVEVTQTSNTLVYGLHPFISWWKNRESGQSALHLFWPLLRRTYRPTAFKGEDWKVFYLFPLLYWGEGRLDQEKAVSRYLLPIYYQGKQGKHEHLIIFPFIWYARDARLIWPLFPTRPQTFAAFWPLYGDFRGWWNRDRIVFFLWPLFITSRKGVGSNAVRTHSFAWPFISFYQGKKYKGFRFWPLISTIKKRGEFHRMYWLWPLGHYRTGVTPDEKSTQTLTAFFPFYAAMSSPKIEYELVFPFYGRLNSGKRETRGYALAIYNTLEDQRRQSIEHRLLWFLIRWKSSLQGAETQPDNSKKPSGIEGAWDRSSTRTLARAPDQATSATASGRAIPSNSETPGTSTLSLFPKDSEDDSDERGWAFFPFYSKYSSPKKERKWILWPFYWHRLDRATQFDFERTYVIPFYSSQERRWKDKAISSSSFVFPFYHSTTRRDGAMRTHALHLWWYDSVDGLDRNYAPLWTFYEKNWNEKTGAERKKILKGLYESEHQPGGEIRRSFNFLFFSAESSEKSSETSLFWGLFSRSRNVDQTSTRLFWVIKF